jgi:hypothetical protein
VDRDIKKVKIEVPLCLYDFLSFPNSVWECRYGRNSVSRGGAWLDIAAVRETKQSF